MPIRGPFDDERPGGDLMFDREVELLRISGAEVRSYGEHGTVRVIRIAEIGGHKRREAIAALRPTLMSPGEIVVVTPNGSCRNRRRLLPSFPAGL